jgi:hypothetical protein
VSVLHVKLFKETIIMNFRLLLTVAVVAMLVGARANAQQRTPQPAPTVATASDEDLAKISEDKNAFLNMFLLPEKGTGSDPSFRHDCGAFALHGLYGEAGWFYQNKGYRSKILWWAGHAPDAVKYKAIDGNGKLWVFEIAKQPDSLEGHQVWIDDNPVDAVAPVHFEWAVQAK